MLSQSQRSQQTSRALSNSWLNLQLLKFSLPDFIGVPVKSINSNSLHRRFSIILYLRIISAHCKYSGRDGAILVGKNSGFSGPLVSIGVQPSSATYPGALGSAQTARACEKHHAQASLPPTSQPGPLVKSRGNKRMS